MAKALVTGATGFIGRHLARALVERGDSVTCLVRETSNRKALEPLGVQFAVGNMTDPESLRRAFAEVDVVYHLAAMLKAPWRQAFFDDNVGGTRNIVEACAATTTPPTLVVVSSMAAHGPSFDAQPLSETAPPTPVSIYGRVKLACDAEVIKLGERVQATIVRPPMVFGEGDPTTFNLFRSVRSGLHLLPNWRGLSVSMIHAGDLSRMLIQAAEKGERVSPSGESGQGVYFSAHQTQPTYANLGRMVARALGREGVRVLAVPGPLFWTAAAVSELIGRLRDKPTFMNLDKVREASGGSWICSVDKARRDLEFDPPPAAQRLKQTADWYQAEGWFS